MKKILLSMAVAIVALSANAATPIKKNVQMKFNAQKVMKLDANMVAPVKAATPAKFNASKKAEGDVFGNFVHRYDGTVVEGFIGANPETILNTNYQLPYTDENGQETTIACNVKTESFIGYPLEMYGVTGVDPETNENILTFPYGQIVWKDIALNDGSTCNATVFAVDADFQYAYPLSYVQDESGSWICSQPTLLLMAIDPNTGDQLGYLEKLSNSALGLANGVCNYQQNVPANGKWSGWQEASSVVSVEDFEAQVSVYGFAGSKFDVNVDEDCTVHMPTGQIMADQDCNSDDGQFGFIHITGCSTTEPDEDGYYQINLDDNLTEVLGKIEGNTMTFNVFAILSNYLEGLGAYWKGYFNNVSVILDNDDFAAWKTLGIKDVKGTKEDQIRNAKSYNLMGQRVFGGKAKGLLVRDGKKYIAK